jgi:putative magnesium chelatase accessory protein
VNAGSPDALAPAEEAPDGGAAAATGRLVAALGRRWYVEVSGRGPVALLVHGTGASARSWRDVAPRLAARCTVVAVDLPGHGRTEAPADRRLALEPMADDLAALLRAEGLAPSFAVGHSAGVAVLLAMALRRASPIRLVVGFGAALVPPPWAYSTTLAPLVNRVATTGAFARAAAFVARRRGVVDSMLRSTGSALPPESVAEYRATAASSAHVRATLAMMANWDLRPLAARLADVDVPVALATGDRDEWTPAATLAALVARMPRATLTVVPGAGHVLHEEMPAFAARFALDAAARAGVVPADLAAHPPVVHAATSAAGPPSE